MMETLSLSLEERRMMERERERDRTRDEAAALTIRDEIERAKQRCRAVIDQILNLNPSPSPSHPNRTLLRLAHSELSFLSRLSDSTPNSKSTPISLSSNIGHLEAVVHILQQPFVNGVSRVCKPISIPSPDLLQKRGQKNATTNNSVHVDVVCTLNGNPTWFLVSARNPDCMSWNGSSCRNKCLRTRIEQVLDAAARSSPATKPCSVILYFANGLDKSTRGEIEREFGASEFGMEFSAFDLDFSEELEDGWIYVNGGSFGPACVLEIKVDQSMNGGRKIECGFKDPLLGVVSTREDLTEESVPLDSGCSLCCLISRMKLHPLDVKDAEFAREKGLSGEADLINFDTTALIALISGISNGGTEKILATSETELRQRLKSNYEFVIAQVMSEIQNPIHPELHGVLSGKTGMICESVRSEFKGLVSLCGGPKEKSRASHLLKCLMVVPDSPLSRMMSLPNTRKLAFKNKVCFGTGDYWRAPTLTANMAFVRAVSQTGMSLFTIEHRPRALTGE